MKYDHSELIITITDRQSCCSQVTPPLTTPTIPCCQQGRGQWSIVKHCLLHNTPRSVHHCRRNMPLFSNYCSPMLPRLDLFASNYMLVYFKTLVLALRWFTCSGPMWFVSWTDTSWVLSAWPLWKGTHCRPGILDRWMKKGTYITLRLFSKPTCLA